MITALNDEQLDLAVLLTEAAVAGIAQGGHYRIVSLYTQTPLVWGIHVPAQSSFSAIDDIKNARYAISRYGSGSHLMCFAHARERAWSVDNLKFELVGSLDGAVAAFERGSADVFLWEKFMTKPPVDSGQFRCIGEFIAPWPAFVVCASERALRDKRAAIMTVLQRVFVQAEKLAAESTSADQIEARYGLKRADARQWLELTRWASSPNWDSAAEAKVINTLQQVGLIAAEFSEAVYVAI